jgi:hypothetical protein
MRSWHRGLVVIAVLAAVTSGVACGAAEPEREPAVASTSGREEGTRTESERADSEVVGHDSRWSWFTFGAWTAGDRAPPPLAEQLAVFGRPRQAKDHVPQEVLDFSLRDLPAMKEHVGRELPDQSRLALADAGKQKVDVYVLPTTRGHVCRYVVDPAEPLFGAGGCDQSLYKDVIWRTSGDRHTLEVEGLVANSVARVEVEVWGSAIDADVGGNAFYLRMTLERSCPAAVGGIVLHYRNGESRVVSLLDGNESALGETPNVGGCP